MFSIARSRLALPTQFLFLVINALGLLLGVVYNSQTPDMYENNAHHKIGWTATWVMSAEVVMGLLFAYAGKDKDGDHNSKGSSAPHEREAFLPVSTTAPGDQQEQYRWSGDSGQGTERSSSSLQLQHASADRARRVSRSEETRPLAEKPNDDKDEHEDDDDGDYEFDGPRVPRRRRFFKNSFVDKFLTKRVPGLFSGRILKGLRVLHTIIERTILLLGFIAIASGGVTYGGIFVRPCSGSPLSPNQKTFFCNLPNFSRRKPTPSSAASRTSSKAGSSCGSDCSRWADGWAALPTLVGLGT